MLKAFFEPASVAVIGASTNPAKPGHAVLKNIVEGQQSISGLGQFELGPLTIQHLQQKL